MSGPRDTLRIESDRHWVLLTLAIVSLAGAAIVSGTGVATAQSSHCDATVQNGESIQDAINGSASGATVCVANGTYEQTLTVDVQGLTLSAADGASPVLDGNDTYGTAITATAANVTVDGFTVENYEESSVVIDGASNATIRGLNVTSGGIGSDVHGVVVQNAPETTVEDSVALDHEHGIYVTGADDVTVENVTAMENDEDGVYATDALNLRISNSTLDSNDGNGVGLSSGADGGLVATNSLDDNGDAGVQLATVVGVEVRDNNATGSSTGINLLGAEDSIVVNNTVTDSREVGLSVGETFSGTASANDSILDNVVTESGDEGILIEDADELTVTGNLVEGNANEGGGADVGIYVRNSDDSTFADNVIRDNQARGIYLNGVEDFNGNHGPNRNAVLKNNTISGHDVSIDLHESPNATIDDNVLDTGLVIEGLDLADFDHVASNNTVGGDPLVFANGADAPTIPGDAGQVIVVNSTNVDVSGHAFDGVAAGIQIAYSDGAVVDGNTLTSMGGSEEPPYERGAIAIWGGSNVTVSENVVDGSDWVGISAHDTVDASVRDNDVNGTLREGVFVARAVGTDVSGNEITDGAGGLAVIDDTDDTSITDNVVDRHEGAGIVLEKLTGLTVSNNTVSNGTDGVRFSDTGRPIQDAVFVDNEIVDNDDVGVDSGTQEAHVNVTVTSNVVERNGDGISVSGGAVDLIVVDNYVANNTADGIYVRGGDVRNNTVTANGEHGIVVNDEGLVENNTVSSNVEHGIEALGGQLLGNTIADNGLDGIHLDGYENDRVANNTLSGHDVDLRTVESTNATIVDNVFESGIFVDGKRGGGYQGDLEYLQHDLSNNTVGGDPLVYAASVDTPAVPADAGQVILFNATNVTVADHSFDGVASPIQVTYSENVTIRNVTVADSPIDGVTVGVSETVTITESSISGSGGQGILAEEAGAFVVSETVVTASDGNGLTVEVLDPANGSALTNNTVTDNAIGIDLASELDFNNVTISGNVVHDNDAEGLLLADDAVDLVVSDNSFDGNGVGLLYDASFSPPNLNATDNWWGDASGPSGGVTDANNASVDADGSGDSIEIPDGEDRTVAFSPWLTESPIDGPAANFTVSPSAPYEGEQVTFDASNASASGGIAEYRWDVTGNGSVDAVTTGPTFAYTYATNGTYDVELTVVDGTGVTDTTNRTVEVRELEPLGAAVDWTPATPEPGDAVSFDAGNSTAPSSPIVEYRWTWGDGTTDTTTTPEIAHTYAAAGSYEVQLVVEDGLGETNATNRTVHVAEDGTAIWNVTTDERMGRSSPTVVDGTAYVGTFNGTVYAVDTATGTVEWTFQHDPYREHDSPTVVDGVVYVASQDDVREGTLYALDADTGTELWNASLGRAPEGTSVLGDTVYVTTGPDTGDNSGYVRAYDTADGDLRWSYETTNPTTTAPTVTDGTVYAGDDLGTLYALDADTGTETWTFEGNDTIPRAPTVANGTVYVPANELLPDPDVDVDQYQGYLYALDATDGSTVWAAPYTDGVTNRGLTSVPTVHDGTIFVGGGDGELLAVDATDGSEVWRFQTQDRVRSSPTVVSVPGEIGGTDDAVVYVGSDDGSVYAIGATSGTAQWIFDAGGWVGTSPTVADGVVYVGASYFAPGDPDTVVDDGERAGDLYAIDAGVNGSSNDSRVVLGTLGHNELLQSYLDVEITSTNGTVLEGETIVVEATVSNYGQETTESIELEDFGGAVVDSETVTVGRNAQTVVTLELSTSVGDADIGTVTVTSPDDADSAEVAIQQEVDFAGCRVIETPGVYTVTGGQLSNSTCIEITSSYVELDGNGIGLQGGGGMDPGAHGIHVDGRDGQLTNVVVRDVYLVDWASLNPDNAGIRVHNVTNSEFTGVNVEESYYGLWADGLTDSVVEEGDFTTTISAGISLDASSNNTIRNTEIAEPFYGIDLDAGSNDTVVTNGSVAGSIYGLRILGPTGVEISNVDGRYTDADFYRDAPITAENYTLSAPSNVTIEEITGEYSAGDTVYASDTVVANVSVVPAPDVTVSFEALNVDLQAVHSPAANPSAHALGQYVAVRDDTQGEESYLDLEVHYDEAHLDGVAESKLSLWRYDANTEIWSEITGASVDTDRNVVAANLTAFGTVGVFVDDPGSADPAAPPTAEVTGVTMIASGDNAWQDLEEPATHLGGANWSVTIDVADLPTSADDTYDLGLTFENEYGQVRSVSVGTGLEVVPAGSGPDTAVTSASVDRTSVDPGATVTVSAEVENVGGAAGDHTASLDVDGSVVDTATVTVAAGATEGVTFTYTAPDAGSFTVSVDGVAAGTVTVEDPDDDGGSSPPPSPTPTPDPEPAVSVDDTDDGASAEITDAAAGEPVTIPLDGTVTANGTDLTALEVTTTEDADYEVTVEASEEPPANESDLPESADALLYLDVEHDLADDQIEGAAFEFTVSTATLEARGIDAESVVLYHRVDGTWVERETTVVDERADAVDLHAEVPHFSWFAVAGTSPRFELVNVSVVETNLSVGDGLGVEAVIENVGTAGGTSDLTLEIDGEIVQTTNGTADPGERDTVTFDYAFDEPGTYEVAVEGEVVGNVTVTDPTDDGDDGSEDDSEGDDSEGDDGSEDDGDGDDGDGDDGDGDDGDGEDDSSDGDDGDTDDGGDEDESGDGDDGEEEDSGDGEDDSTDGDDGDGDDGDDGGETTTTAGEDEADEGDDGTDTTTDDDGGSPGFGLTAAVVAVIAVALAVRKRR